MMQPAGKRNWHSPLLNIFIHQHMPIATNEIKQRNNLD